MRKLTPEQKIELRDKAALVVTAISASIADTNTEILAMRYYTEQVSLFAIKSARDRILEKDSARSIAERYGIQ